MIIDIVEYTEEQFAALSAEKLMEIREAQIRKNGLLEKLQKALETEKQRLIDRGVFLSTIWEKKSAELTEEYEKEVEVLREGLLFYLHYAVDENGQLVEAPYTVDYSLSEVERAAVVKAYYEGAYTDAGERYQAFLNDTFAKKYLGEKYASLYHYFKNLSES